MNFKFALNNMFILNSKFKTKETAMRSQISHLILFISISLIVSCSPLKKLAELPEVKSWEKDIARFDSMNRVEQYPDDAVIFAGSSSIRIWKNLAEDMAPFSIIQRGYGGAKLSDFAVYAPRIFTPHKCSAAVVFVGNDITGSQNDKSPEEVRKLFLSVLKSFRKSHPKTPFFWVQVTPTPARWKVWNEILKANELIRKECERHPNTYFIRTDYAFLDNNGLPRSELFLPDKLHLNAEGYKLWTQIIKDELKRVLDKENL